MIFVPENRAEQLVRPREETIREKKTKEGWWWCWWFDQTEEKKEREKETGRQKELVPTDCLSVLSVLSAYSRG